MVQAAAVRLTHHAFMHTTDQKWTIDLLKVLDDMNAPDYAFSDILTWARGANYSFIPPGGLSQSKSVDLLFDAMPKYAIKHRIKTCDFHCLCGICRPFHDVEVIPIATGND